MKSLLGFFGCLCLCFILGCSNKSPLAEGGSGTQTGNARVVGKIVSEQGTPIKQAEVQMVPVAYNPVQDAALPDSLKSATDSVGQYEIPRVPFGTYNVQSVLPQSHKLSLQRNLQIAGVDSIWAKTDTLRNSAVLAIPLTSAIRDSTGYVYVAGTTAFAKLDSAQNDTLLLGNIAQGALPPIYFSTRDTSRQPLKLYDSIVVAADTVKLDTAVYRGTRVNVSTATEMQNRIAALLPGDTLAVSAGQYDLSSTWSLSGINGTANAWIVIQADGRAVIRGISPSSNVVEIANSHFVKFEGFEIVYAGTGQNDGLKFPAGTSSSYIVLKNLHVHRVTNAGIHVVCDSASFITILHCRVDSALGFGIKVGSNLHDVSIQNNYVSHCPYDALLAQPYASGIVCNGWTWRVRICDNVIHDAGTSGIFLSYGRRPLAGDDPSDASYVSGNAVWNVQNEGMTVMSDAVVENNIIFNAGRGMNVQNYSDNTFTGVCAIENLRIQNNTVFRCSESCIKIFGWENANASVSLTGNAFYQTETAKPAVDATGLGPAFADKNYYYGKNLTIPGFTAGNGLMDFSGITVSSSVPSLDFYPASAASFLDVLDNSSNYPIQDFNTTTRPQNSMADAGAYERLPASNPGWIIKKGFKNE